MKLIRKNTTNRMAEANRANAKKSTGPRTAQGIANSSRNAVKHGILAEKLPPGLKELGEDAGEFARLRDGLLRAFHPGDDLERMLVADMANIRWRYSRCLRAEAQLQVPGKHEATAIETDRDVALLLPDKDLSRVIRYETHLMARFWNTFRGIMTWRQTEGEPYALADEFHEGLPILPKEIGGGKRSPDKEGAEITK